MRRTRPTPRCPLSRLNKFARRARLGIETLEGREVPSAVPINELLTVRGSSGNEAIEISGPQANRTVVKVGGVTQFDGIDVITRIRVDGLNGIDSLAVNGIQANVTDGVCQAPMSALGWWGATGGPPTTLAGP